MTTSPLQAVIGNPVVADKEADVEERTENAEFAVVGSGEQCIEAWVGH